MQKSDPVYDGAGHESVSEQFRQNKNGARKGAGGKEKRGAAEGTVIEPIPCAAAKLMTTRLAYSAAFLRPIVGSADQVALTNT